MVDLHVRSQADPTTRFWSQAKQFRGQGKAWECSAKSLTGEEGAYEYKTRQT